MKTIKSYPNYAINKDAQVFNKKTMRCLKQIISKTGYKTTTLCNNKKYDRVYIHRLMLETFIGKCPEGMECRHLDGNKLNNNLSNLKWGTRKENSADRKKHGNLVLPCFKGEKHAMAKLTEEDVKLILAYYFDADYTQKELANFFKVDLTTVNKIVNKHTWKYLWELK